ncbi:MAG: helicase C-terminal domain-containing protein [Planctomycetota bacterium]
MIYINQQPALNVSEIFSPNGDIARAYTGFETRPQQLKMACAVQTAFEKPAYLVVEAGTGVGKSFAYLVPAVSQVLTAKAKVLISTFTITLQEQLINKDIPFLIRAIDRPFTAVLAKGRANYLCLRRMNFAKRRGQSLFNDFGKSLQDIIQWASQTADGSLSDLTFPVSANLWDAVKSEHGNCKARKCPHYRNCFYWRARRKLESADIIIANHALLFSDLILKQQHTGILPEYRYIVIDEAHNIEHVAEEQFGIEISNFTFSFLFSALYNPVTKKGILTFAPHADSAVAAVAACSKAAKNFFREIKAWYELNKNLNNGRCYPNFLTDTITEPVKHLRSSLAKLAKNTPDEDEKLELDRFIDRIRKLEQDLTEFLTQPKSQNVYWIELSGPAARRCVLQSAPVNVAPHISRTLFDNYESVILTSATLSTDGKKDKTGFDFFTGRIGLQNFEHLQLGSPFDYNRQVTMYIETDLPDPNTEDFTDAAVNAVKKYIRLTAAKAFVLFTSYTMLNDMAEKIEDWLNKNNIKLLRQGAGIDRSKLLTDFRTGSPSVLFGTDSFWQGVDVPGQALSNVIIVKLPFAVPNHPLIAGKLEQIRSQGQNPFYKYQLPTAIIKFKQGFGRLIRNKTDTGIVVVLDSRIIHKTYGRMFLDAVPQCRLKLVSK